MHIAEPFLSVGCPKSSIFVGFSQNFSKMLDGLLHAELWPIGCFGTTELSVGVFALVQRWWKVLHRGFGEISVFSRNCDFRVGGVQIW